MKPSTADSKRIPQLDGIRGVAIILVLVWHYGNNQIIANDFTFLHWFRIGTSFFWSGVDLFFVLSGFLLGGILLRNRNSDNYFKTFYIRRICRIFPLYYFYFLVFLLLGYIAGDVFPWLFGSPPEPLPWWSYATYTQNILMGTHQTLGSHGMVATWSLALEEQFYLVLPLCIYFVKERRLVILCVLFIIASPLLRYYCSNWYQSFAYPYCRADSLLMGVLLAYVMQQEKAMVVIRRYKSVAYTLFFLLLLLIGVMSFYFSKMHINYVLLNSIVAVFFALFILLALLEPNFISKTLRNRLLVRTGVISYGIYIYHLFISGIFHQLFFDHAPLLTNTNNLLVTLLSLVMTFIVAALSYNFFEKKLIALGHRYRY